MPRHSTTSGLTTKQERFVLEYLKDGNAGRSAAAAGYSKKTANRIGSELLEKAHVRAAIDAGQKKLLNRLELNAEKVLKNIERLAGKAETAGKIRDAIDGWVWLGKHLKLFTEKHEHGGIGGGAIALTISETDEKL